MKRDYIWKKILYILFLKECNCQTFIQIKGFLNVILSSTNSLLLSFRPYFLFLFKNLFFWLYHQRKHLWLRVLLCTFLNRKLWTKLTEMRMAFILCSSTTTNSILWKRNSFPMGSTIQCQFIFTGKFEGICV